MKVSDILETFESNLPVRIVKNRNHTFNEVGPKFVII